MANSLHRARTELDAYCIALHPRYELTQHHRLVIDKLEAIVRGEIDRLMLFLPPRHGKSLLASTLFPAWYLGRHPECSVICASYGQELANDFGRRVRSFVSSDLHRMIFPASCIADDNAAVHRFGLSRGGNYYAVGVGGPITGRGADLLLIDDPLKGSEDAYSVTARRSCRHGSRASPIRDCSPTVRIVLIQTRWHQDDLAGWLLREHAGDNWTVVSLPAIAEPGDALGRPEGDPLWPSKFPLEALARIREAIGSSAWSALYQQRPIAAEGAIFRKEWLRTFTGQPECYRVIFSLDTAYKQGTSNDYSVIAVWGETQNGFYLLDLVRERLDFPSLKSRTIAKAAYWKPSAVLIEDAASGQSLIQSLNLETRLPILPAKPLGDKESRASAVSPLFESGRVFIPQAAPWLVDFVDEITSFPAAPHDDQVDATTQALTWLHRQGNHSYHDYVAIPRASHGFYDAGGAYSTDRSNPDVDFGKIAAIEDRQAEVDWMRVHRWGKWRYC